MKSTATIYTEVTFYQEKVEIGSGRGYWEKSHYISRGATGHWTKWGGGRMNLLQEASDVWHCQSCSASQPIALSPYKYEYPEGEWIRVCAMCIADGCITLKQRLG